MRALGWEGAFRPGFGNKKRTSSRKSSSSGSSGGSSSSSHGLSVRGVFPLKQAVTAGTLALAGDTIAQVNERFRKTSQSHDWLRSLRMASYGFLLYGPGSHAWYQLLDWAMPQKTAINLSIKVAANQLVLGPCVIAVVFAWNSLWLGKLKQLPAQYRQKALPTLIDGWKFWTPASVLNFSVVPLDARVAFMSCCSIFWNFYLSTAIRA